MAQLRRGKRTNRITTNLSINLHPTPSAALALIAIYGAKSQPTGAQINTRTSFKDIRLVQGPSSFNMQATMSPVPFPMSAHLASAQTTLATGSAAYNLRAPLLRHPSTPSLRAPTQKLVRHATAPEPRAYTPHPSRNKRKASFSELSPEVAERPSKRPKIERTNSGTVANHVAMGGSSRN